MRLASRVSQWKRQAWAALVVVKWTAAVPLDSRMYSYIVPHNKVWILTILSFFFHIFLIFFPCPLISFPHFLYLHLLISSSPLASFPGLLLFMTITSVKTWWLKAMCGWSLITPPTHDLLWRTGDYQKESVLENLNLNLVNVSLMDMIASLSVCVSAVSSCSVFHERDCYRVTQR